MKKFLKILGLAIASVLALLVVLILLARYVFKEQLQGWVNDMEKGSRVELLRTSGAFEPDTISFDFEYISSVERTQAIRDYFGLDSLLVGSTDTWSKAIKLAGIAAQVKHDNPDPWPSKHNAIDLWEWSKQNPGGFNCRMHSILLHELLLSEGIFNRVVTCMPEDESDSDCHVVNVVWLPEQERWVMIDSDNGCYIADENGTPISLREMRERFIADQPMQIHRLNGEKITNNYLLPYWAKNLYYFSSIETTAYDIETSGTSDLIYVYLLSDPKVRDRVRSDRSKAVFTTDVDRFWAAPSDTIKIVP